MNLLSRIWFPITVLAFAGTGVADFGSPVAVSRRMTLAATPGNSPMAGSAADTVIYPPYAFRHGYDWQSDSTLVLDSLYVDEEMSFDDTLPQKLSPRDSLKALLDSTLWDKIDSIYIADSIAKAKAAFEAWYNALSKKEQRKYDIEQRNKLMMARADSLREVKQAKQDMKDSIRAEKPRILETYSVPDSMQYKRMISWTLDQDFHKMDVGVPDTSYNYYFYDYRFQRNDVNATWLGVAGSPVQYYDFNKRAGTERVDFYTPQESWSYSPSTLPHYNTKTPYTELAYWGTILSTSSKESDNIRIFTTQNITPELNIALTYERFGGGGMLDNEEVNNQNFVLQSSYLGKRYMMHAGYISNSVSRDENGGMTDVTWVRDTTVDARDIPVNLSSASSKIKKNTVFLDQQLRIPFNFLLNLKERKDSTVSFSNDTLVRDVTTAFIGHSTEFSIYNRKYTDNITTDAGREFYNNVFNYNSTSSADSMRVMKLDNKVYLRLQPWASDGVVSKLDIGIGDTYRTYFDSTSVRPTTHTENTVYIYGGAEGQVRNNFFWNAKAKFSVLGYEVGDFEIQANGLYAFYPFRRARKSPVSIGVNFSTTLLEPTWYQQHINSNHYSWDNDFGKVSTTSVGGTIDIPRWRLNASAQYNLLSNQLYYDNDGIIRQHSDAMSVFTAYLRKEFVFGPLHLDNKALFQLSSNQTVVPVPLLALNLRWYMQFVVQRTEDKAFNVMVMQIGVNGLYNTSWYTPAWNPNLGVFYNQTERTYTNGPYFDIFVNIQWKRACIFIKYQNAGGGWPLRKHDYFSADRYILTQNGFSGLKLGLYWPFYTLPSNRRTPQR